MQVVSAPLVFSQGVPIFLVQSANNAANGVSPPGAQPGLNCLSTLLFFPISYVRLQELLWSCQWWRCEPPRRERVSLPSQPFYFFPFPLISLQVQLQTQQWWWCQPLCGVQPGYPGVSLPNQPFYFFLFSIFGLKVQLEIWQWSWCQPLFGVQPGYLGVSLQTQPFYFFPIFQI